MVERENVGPDELKWEMKGEINEDNGQGKKY